MSSENQSSQNPLSESELDQVAGGGLISSIGKINKGGGRSEKPPVTTLPIDIKPK